MSGSTEIFATTFRFLIACAYASLIIYKMIEIVNGTIEFMTTDNDIHWLVKLILSICVIGIGICLLLTIFFFYHYLVTGWFFYDPPNVTF